MKILITGATGYIGQKLMVRLLNEGHEIHALCRHAPKTELFGSAHVKIFHGDLINREIVDQAMAGCEQVYHLAGYAKVWAKVPTTYFEVNVQGTVNVLDSALRHNIRKLIFTSTGGTYGVSNGKLLQETSIRNVDFFNEFESSKFLAEERVLAYVHKGLDAVIVHPTRVYGPGTWTESNAISQLIKLYVTGEWHIVPGSGKALGCFSYIDDVVDGHILAMEKGVAGEKYILGGENIDLNTFFGLLRKLTHKNYLMVNVPVPFMMMYGWKEEIAANLFGKPPLITRKWIRKYNFDASFSSEKAIRELGYTITPLETGLSRTLEWLQNDYHVSY